jgi:hypothetical protein
MELWVRGLRYEFALTDRNQLSNPDRALLAASGHWPE